MGTLTSQNMRMKSGDMTISITGSPFPAANFEVSGLSPLSGNWDLEQNSQSADSILFSHGNFIFKAFDKISDGSSLIEDVSNISTLIEVTIQHTFHSGASFTDKFKFNKQDVSYDRAKREVTFKTRTNFRNTTPIDTFIAGATTTYIIEQQGGGGTQFDCVHILDLIREGFGDEVNSAGSNLVESDRYDTVSIADTYVVVDNAEAPNYTVEDMILYMAALEGGILGSLLGYNFYEYRLDTTNAVTLSTDDFQDWGIVIGHKAYNTITVHLDNTNIVSNPQGTWQESDSAQYNSIAKKNLSITYEPVSVNRADWQGLVGVDFYADGGGTLSSVVPTAGLDAYAAAYGADGKDRLTFEIINLETLDPNQPFTLDTSFPAFLQSTTWRPSEIEYDFEADIIRGTAYQIA